MRWKIGTRSLTVFKDRDEEIVVLYRQMDGYPSGHGKDLKDILEDYILVNGYTSDQTYQKVANGMGCLAIQCISQLSYNLNKDSYESSKKMQEVLQEKLSLDSPTSRHVLQLALAKEKEEPESFLQGPNQLHLHPVGTRDLGEEYIYTVYNVNSDEKEDSGRVLILKVECGRRVLYDGPIKEFNPKEEFFE